MAGTAVAAVQDFVNGDKKTEDDSDIIEPKDFFWDQFLKYISSAILALIALTISVDFLRGDGGVKCFPPPDVATLLTNDPWPNYEFGRDQVSYINNYCTGSIPITEYFPIYILVHGIFLIAPHYMWSAVFKGNFDSFFSIAEKFDRLRSSETGQYQEENFDRVKKLEYEFGGTRRIFNAYILKLGVQFFVCLGSVVFSAIVFTDFTFSFDCPSDFDRIPKGWPLNTTVECVYTSLRILPLVRYVDFILNALAGVLALIGLVWCFVRHTQELGHIEIARFSFQSCLNSECYIFPPVFSWPSYPCCVKEKEKKSKLVKYVTWIFTHYPYVHIWNLFSPQIKSDLDFLVMRLFRADSSHGKVFKDIQISKVVKNLIGRDHQLLHLYINLQQDPNMRHRPKDMYSEQDIEDFHDIFLASGFCFREPEKLAYRYFEKHVGNLEFNSDDFSGVRDWIYWFAATFSPMKQHTSTQNSNNGLQNSTPSALSPGDDQDSTHASSTHEQSSSASCLTSGTKSSTQRARNGLAVDISFGSIGFSLVLARPFKRVLSTNFDPFFRGYVSGESFEKTVKDDFYTNYTTVKFPEDVFTQRNDWINEAYKQINDFIKDLKNQDNHPIKIDFLMIGPINEEPKKISVNLLINLLYTSGHIGEEALLLAARPLKIAAQKLSKCYYEYKPSKKLFEDVHLEVERELKKLEATKLWSVDEKKGIRFSCGNVPCVFEFSAYRYRISNKETGFPSKNQPWSVKELQVDVAPNNASQQISLPAAIVGVKNQIVDDTSEKQQACPEEAQPTSQRTASMQTRKTFNTTDDTIPKEQSSSLLAAADGDIDDDII